MKCPTCHRQNPPNSNFCPSCGGNLTSETPQQNRTLAYAGFWRRLGATIIDTILLNISAIIFVGIIVGEENTPNGLNEDSAAGLFFLFYLTAIWLYFTLLESSSQRATIGKMALGIIVTDLNGNRVSFGKATGRFLGRIISLFSFLIGYLMAGFTPKKQALHDIISGCLVITKKSLPQHIIFEAATTSQNDNALKNRIIIDITPLFQAADYSALVIKGLNTGEEVELTGVKDSGGSEWMEVKCSDGQTGFISGDTPVLNPNIKWSFTQGPANLYEQPSIQSQIKKQYHKGDEFYQGAILKNADQTWIKICDVAGNEGYIEGDTKLKES